MYLARSSLGRRPGWNVTFCKSTGYSHNLVLKVATKIYELLQTYESEALKTKFEHPKYMEASLTPISLKNN